MRFVVLDPLKAERAAGLSIHDDFHLGEIEVERTISKTAPAQNRRQLPSGMQTAREFVVRRSLQDGEGLLVGEPPRALDDGARKAGAADRTVPGEPDEDG